MVEACIWWGDNPLGILDLKRHADPRAEFFIEVEGPKNKPRPTGVLVIVTQHGEDVNVPVGAYVVLDRDGFPFVMTKEAFEEAFET